jgi:peroxiredoxin
MNTTPRRQRTGRRLFLGILIVAAAAWWFGSSLANARRRLNEGNLALEAKEFLHDRNVKPLSEPLQQILDAPKSPHVPTQAHPLLGKPAPDFELVDHLGTSWRLGEQLREGPVLLIFYFGYFCSHCVSQLFAVHEDMGKFRELGVRVLAISPDPPALTAERFKQYGAFSFPVLADPDRKLASVYGALKSEKGEPLHGTFVIGRDGVLTWAQIGEQPFTDNATLLYELRKLKPARPQ